MKLSMKVDYGVRALMDLAQHYGQGPVQSGEIAARQKIPEPFLDQLLATLRKAGLVRSMRGPLGGHTLARPSGEINLGEAIIALEGSWAPLDCVEESSRCDRSGTCVQRQVWQRVAQATRHILEATTIEDLARQQGLGDARAMYHI